MNEQTAELGKPLTQLMPREFKKRLSSKILSMGDLPIGATIEGEILSIGLPEKSEFKTPIVTILRGDGSHAKIPLWASLRDVLGKTDKENKEVIGEKVWLKRSGTSKSKKTNKEYPTFDGGITVDE